MSRLSDMPNIGPELERLLEEVDIRAPEQLREAGAELAFLRLKEQDPTACFHKLTALEGAVLGIKKSQIPPLRKAQLRAFFDGIPSLKQTR